MWSGCVQDEAGKSRGFGFVNFETAEGAGKAVEALHEKEIKGKKVWAGRAQKKSEREAMLKQRCGGCLGQTRSERPYKAGVCSCGQAGHAQAEVGGGACRAGAVMVLKAVLTQSCSGCSGAGAVTVWETMLQLEGRISCGGRVNGGCG